MRKSKIYIAAFDFDGTLTTKDTLWEFLKFSLPAWRLYVGLAWLSPVLLLYLTGVLSNHKAKEILFSHYFKGWLLTDFTNACQLFQVKIEEIANKDTLTILGNHKSQNHTVFIVSASIENWIEPWAERYGIQTLATRIQIDSEGKLTGKFSSNNCYGQEKVNRLSQVLPAKREDYYLYAYGDSRGDRELINFADEGTYVK